MVELLSDPERTGVIPVTTPEEMPVTETLELTERIARETSASVVAVVVNRVLPELFTTREEEVFEALRRPSQAAAISSTLGAEISPVFEAARLAVNLRRARAADLQRLHERLEASVPVLLVPYLFSRVGGLRSTRQVASALADELGL
jgi:anion-transporting  ArsA/GET3 family ATPase